MKPSTKVLKANTGFRVVTHFGVTHHINAENSVAYFKSWKDMGKGTAGGMSEPPTYQGIPMTQDELDTHYPALKENTVLTKAKIGSEKVWFKNLQTPMACMYQGKVYLIAPFDPDSAPVLPKSMTEHKITAPPELASAPAARSKSGVGGKGKVVIGDHSIVQVGATVITKQGVGRLQGIDRTTYSIPFCSVLLTEGAHKHEHIYTPAAELTQKKPKKAAAPKPPRTPAATSDPATVPGGLGGGGIPPIPGMGAAAAPKPAKKAAAPKPPRTPAATSDMASVPVRLGGGGIPPIPGMGAAAAPKPKQAAKPAKKATAPKPKSKAKNGKPAPAGIVLTAAQKKRLAAKGSITIKRDGKFVTITR